jgi:hypothetical protein
LELLFSIEKRAMLKDVVFGVVGPLELFPVLMLDSNCFCNEVIPEAIVGAVERYFGRGKLGPKGGHGMLSARVIRSNSVMIVAENFIRRRKAMTLVVPGVNDNKLKGYAERSDLYTFRFLDSALRIFPLLVRSLRLEHISSQELVHLGETLHELRTIPFLANMKDGAPPTQEIFLNSSLRIQSWEKWTHGKRSADVTRHGV